MNERAAAWFEKATSRWWDWDVSALADRKGEQRVSVVIPAHDEAATIGEIVTRIRTELLERTRLVDEIVVIDSDSSDRTAMIAAASGATVHAARDIRPDLDRLPGKGEALWKSTFVTSGDLLAFIDGDLTEWGPHFVTGLLGPLLTRPDVNLVKGYYDRTLDDGSGVHAPQGGRVTEIVARPLLNLLWPDLACVVQPLAGEWAVRRSTFEALHVPVGYGVEIGALLDVYLDHGLDAIAQVDLGERAHTHQSVHDLGVMAAEILAVAARRAGAAERLHSSQLWQFRRDCSPAWRSREVPMHERPPATSVKRPPC
ncbi:MAG: hypothetical protein JWO57_3868 [Pseudonocardiales bacterium]|nr:hypothetical protein [Pseudonocardiales bacterium]